VWCESVGAQCVNYLPERSCEAKVCSAARVSPLKLFKGGIDVPQIEVVPRNFALLLYAGGLLLLYGNF